MKKLLIFIFILIGLGWGIWHNEDFQRKYIYPFPHQQVVNQYAQRYGVDPYLVAGVAMAESKFSPDSRSSRGAVGIMQLMPDTANWIAGQIQDPNFTTTRLAEPEVNIKYGCWYLGELQDEFKGNKILMLAAYNAGRGNVQQWMEDYHWDYDFADVEQIPFPETKEYVKKVLLNTREYHNLYDK